MTKQTGNVRVLGIAPSTRGVGYAVMEGECVLVDWGVKSVKGDKNARSLSHVAGLVELYAPNVIVLEDTGAKESRRRTRVSALVREIIEMAGQEEIEVRLVSRKSLHSAFLGTQNGTKQALAEHFAKQFSKELGSRIPKKRQTWSNEDCRMDIFDAVALAKHFLSAKTCLE